MIYMKSYIRILIVMIALMIGVVSGAWAQLTNDDVIVEVKPNASAGIVSASVNATTRVVTLSITPASGYYIKASDIVVEKLVNPGKANAPKRRVSEIADKIVGKMYSGSGRTDADIISSVKGPNSAQYVFTVPTDYDPNTNFFDNRQHWEKIAEHILFTGKIDEYFDYQFGQLEWRSVRFEQETLDMPNYQGNAVMNFTDAEVPYTRIIEHKHFEMFGEDVYRCPKTVISREYSSEWHPGIEPFYTVNDERNNNLYKKYKELADLEQNVTFGGRLAEYKYYDIAPIIEKVMGF